MPFAKHRWLWAGLALSAAGVVAVVFLLRDRREYRQDDLPPQAPTFDGPSTDLRGTVFVPTLDTPIPKGKSAVWCGSFQLAWNELKALSGGPIELAGAEEPARRLNESRFTADALPPGAHYAAAGLVRDGIAEQIRSDMARLFPGARGPDIQPGDVATAFAYLQASINFRRSYYDDRLTFRDYAGQGTEVRAFGIRKQEYGENEVRDQVDLLFADLGPQEFARTPVAFAVDLDRFSEPFQVVVAVLPRSPTLEKALAEIRRQAAVKREWRTRFSTTDRLLIPVMSWRVRHRFAELEGPDRRIRGGRLDGLSVDRAYQDVDFRLDRGGAGVVSRAGLAMKSTPIDYLVDRPFLVYLKKRGAADPYFVMWVDNAELLAP
jgi:hypothetical protein